MLPLLFGQGDPDPLSFCGVPHPGEQAILLHLVKQPGHPLGIRVEEVRGICDIGEYDFAGQMTSHSHTNESTRPNGVLTF